MELRWNSKNKRYDGYGSTKINEEHKSFTSKKSNKLKTILEWEQKKEKGELSHEHIQKEIQEKKKEEYENVTKIQFLEKCMWWTSVWQGK